MDEMIVLETTEELDDIVDTNVTENVDTFFCVGDEEQCDERGEPREDVPSPMPDTTLLAAITALRLSLDRAREVVLWEVKNEGGDGIEGDKELVDLDVLPDGLNLRVDLRLVARVSPIVDGYQQFGAIALKADSNLGGTVLVSDFYGEIDDDCYLYCGLRHPDLGMRPSNIESMTYVLRTLAEEIYELGSGGILSDYDELSPRYGELLDEELRYAAHYLTREDLWRKSASDIACLGLRLATAMSQDSDIATAIDEIDRLGGDLSAIRKRVELEDPERDRWAWRRIMCEERPSYWESRKLWRWKYKPYKPKEDGGKK